MNKKEKKVIICGYGLVGERLSEMLSKHNYNITIIDIDPKALQKAKDMGYNVILGDATHATVLEKAGIKNADALAIALDDDAKNLFVVITARDLNKKIYITARATDEFVKDKLLDAGANYVAKPQKVASEEILNALR